MRKDINQLNDLLKKLQMKEPTEQNLESIKKCKGDLANLLEAEETYWH